MPLTPASCPGAVASVQPCVVQHIKGSTVSLHENLCDALAVVLVLSTGALYCWQWLSYSEDWGQLAIPLQKKKKKMTLLCAALMNCQIYTPDSAIHFTAVAAVWCIPYMTPCGAFDPPVHYSIWECAVLLFFFMIYEISILPHAFT